MKAQCPLLAARPVQAPSSATLRLTEGGQGRAEPPKAPGRAYQLVTEEIGTAPEMTAGMSFLLYFDHVIIMRFFVSYMSY